MKPPTYSIVFTYSTKILIVFYSGKLEVHNDSKANISSDFGLRTLRYCKVFTLGSREVCTFFFFFASNQMYKSRALKLKFSNQPYLTVAKRRMHSCRIIGWLVGFP